MVNDQYNILQKFLYGNEIKKLLYQIKPITTMMGHKLLVIFKPLNEKQNVEMDCFMCGIRKQD